MFAKRTPGKFKEEAPKRSFYDGRLGIFIESLGDFDPTSFSKSYAYTVISDHFELGPIDLKQMISFASDKGDKQASFIFPDAKPKKDKFLANIQAVNLLLQKQPDPPDPYSQVRVLPNWYGAGTNNPLYPTGGGGPGKSAQPAALPAPTSQPAGGNPLSFHEPNAWWPNGLGQGTQDVNVFILDTIPNTFDANGNLLNQWDTNAVLARLQPEFGPPGPGTSLRVLPAVPNGITLPPDYQTPVLPGIGILDPQDLTLPVEMNDHGLFITGMIYSMAQDYKARLNIYLIETMNCHGVTSYLTLLQALNWIQQNGGTKLPFVVNMSLIFPTPEQAEQAEIQEGDWLEFLQVLEYTLGLVGGIWQETFDGRGVLVASAGNEDQPPNNPNPPSPCFPASAVSVIGVGALTNNVAPNFQITSYSNQADYPSNDPVADERIWTFGGDYTGVADAGQGGILGITTIGYQWWAGTSFASAIVSGTLAVLLSQKLSQPRGQAAKDYLFRKCFSQPHVVSAGIDLGRVLNVTQGP